MDKQKIRTIITQDAEVDDQNSLRHFLFYSNEVDLQGIVQTSSKFHWIGIPGAVRPEKRFRDDFDEDIPAETGSFDQPYRWTGTDWMFNVIDDYEKDYPNLIKHADGYPTPDYLRSITKIGNIGYEGDSPTFFPLLDWGLRSTENFAYGGFGGRCCKKEDEFNSKGEPLNYWDECKDIFTDRDGNVSDQESMWPYVADIQRDFAARVEWASADAYEKGEHKPSLRITEGVDINAGPGTTVELHAESSCPDGTEVTVSFLVYEDASAECAGKAVLAQNENSASIAIPTGAEPGDQIHVLVKAQSEGHHRLAYYQQVIITIE